MRGALVDRPFLHGSGDYIGDRRIELGPRLDRFLERLKNGLRQPLLHLVHREDVGAVYIVRRELLEIERRSRRLVVRNRLYRLKPSCTVTYVTPLLP